MLKSEMVPALGCTGPTAYALAAARCRPHLTAKPTHMKVYVSPAYLKIGFGVATPGTSDPGIALAAAIGLMGGDWTLGMSVLKPCTPDIITDAMAFVERGSVEIQADWEQTGVYVRAEVTTLNETVVAVVSGKHDGIISVLVNGEELFHANMPSEAIKPNENVLTPDVIFDYVDNMDTDELRFLLDGYQMNLALAEDGIRNKLGLESGRVYLRHCFTENNVPADLYENPLHYLPDDLAQRIKILVSAASDARMGGSTYPAMAAMGDGNQGITAMLPVGLAAEHANVDDEKTIRALTLACLMTFYVKIHIGRASAFCLCAIAASAGAAAGIAYVNGLDRKGIRAAVKNVISPLAGMLCDGAKNGCALKMAIASSTALTAVELAEVGVEMGYFDGVTDDTLEQTVACITEIATKSQSLLDGAMVQSILDKEARKRSERLP